jgi:site-specific recombinase XerD
MLKERVRFLCHLAGQGASKANLRDNLVYLLHIVDALKLTRARTVELDEIAKGGQYWATYQSPYLVKSKRSEVSKHFFHVAREWLRFEGLLTTSPTDLAYGWTLQYRDAILSQGRLASTTVESYVGRVQCFLKWYFARKNGFFIVLKDVDAYFAHTRAEGLELCTIKSHGLALRNFFIYAQAQGWCEPGLSHYVKGPRLSKFNDRKSGPDWIEVRKLIRSSAKGSTIVDIRASAILYLLAIYGLRSSEVTRLKLSDFDWRSETFTVERSKRGGFQCYPIQYEVGNAILKYLKEARPKTSCPELFLTAYRPYRPLTAGPMWEMVASRMKSLDITSAHIGPHSLRHACAMRLLQRGLSLREIADFLGHRNSETVAIYARPDTRSLRKVATLSLAGLC